MNPFDVICLGNATVDIFMPLDKSDQNFSVEENEIKFRLGDKFLADGYHISPGGIANNVSVGLSRLGKKVALIAEVGNDLFKSKVIENLKTNNVSSDLVVIDSDNQTAVSAIIQQGLSHIIFSSHQIRKHDFTLEKASWLFLTGLGNRWEHAYEKALDFAKEGDMKIAFAPGINQIQEGKDKILNALGQSDIFFINLDEAQIILDENSDDIRYLLTSLKKLGPKNVVMTYGTKGSFVLDNNLNLYNCPMIEAGVTETTGAGDGYASGFLASFIEDQNLEKAMTWGAANASGVVEKVGAQEGLLKKEELEQRLTSANITVSKI